MAGDMKCYCRRPLVHVVVESDDFAGAENVLDLGAGWSAVGRQQKPRILVPHPAQAVARELDPVTGDSREADLEGFPFGQRADSAGRLRRSVSCLTLVMLRERERD